MEKKKDESTERYPIAKRTIAERGRHSEISMCCRTIRAAQNSIARRARLNPVSPLQQAHPDGSQTRSQPAMPLDPES